jgi:arsenate reductase (thioredoxin)
MNYKQVRNCEPIQSALADSATRLAGEYHGVFSQETVARAIDDSWGRLTAQATLLPPFFPVLVERFARDQLRAAAQVDCLIAKDLPEVLFVCERNAGRSQMAASITHHVSHGAVAVRSAGSQPGEHLDPVVIEAMQEIGLDVTHEFPKPLTDIVVRAGDVVITMGRGDSCPIYPGKRYQDWDIADPAEQPIVRVIRDDIQAHVVELLGTLTHTLAP